MKKIKKTPTEIIESTSNPRLERAYMKVPGRLLDVSKDQTEMSVRTSKKDIQNNLDRLRRKDYTGVHTHQTNRESYVPYSPISLPSDTDLKNFLKNPKEKTMIIAERNINTGKVLGYTLIKKTEKTPDDFSSYSGFQLLKDLNEYMRYQIFEPPNIYRKVIRRLFGETTSTDYDPEDERFLVKRKNKDSAVYEKAIKDFCDKYHLQYKNISNKKGNKESSLEGKVSVFILFILGGIALGAFSLTATGNVISNLTGTSQGLLGIFLFIIGLVGMFFWFRNR